MAKTEGLGKVIDLMQRMWAGKPSERPAGPQVLKELEAVKKVRGEDVGPWGWAFGEAGARPGVSAQVACSCRLFVPHVGHKLTSSFALCLLDQEIKPKRSAKTTDDSGAKKAKVRQPGVK